MNNFGTRFKKKKRINFMKIIMAKTVETIKTTTIFS